MSAELRLKKLRGSGGYVMAKVDDNQQAKGNLGGPDLFLAPIGRLEEDKISKYFCNTCEKEFEGSPKIDYENPNEEVAENLVLREKGQYICTKCGSTLAEYREFQKPDEQVEVGAAKSIQQQEASQTQQVSPTQETERQSQSAQAQIQPSQAPQADVPAESSGKSDISSIEGLTVYDEAAKKVGTAKQVGIDSNQNLVLIITKNDGTKGTVAWNKVKKVGEIIILGTQAEPQQQTATQPETATGKCPSCGFENKAGSKFCEECGTKL